MSLTQCGMIMLPVAMCNDYMLKMEIDHLLRCNVDAMGLQCNCFGTIICDRNINYLVQLVILLHYFGMT